MSKIKNGATVQINYTLTVDGEELDNSKQQGGPLTYVQGSGQILPGLEEDLKGMHQGDAKEVVLPPERAFGNPDPSAVQTFPKGAFDDPDSINEGSLIQGKTADGKEFQATVKDIRDDQVILDFNHPLAGKTLHFDVEVVNVEATSDNSRNG